MILGSNPEKKNLKPNFRQILQEAKALKKIRRRHFFSAFVWIRLLSATADNNFVRIALKCQPITNEEETSKYFWDKTTKTSFRFGNH